MKIRGFNYPRVGEMIHREGENGSGTGAGGGGTGGGGAPQTPQGENNNSGQEQGFDGNFWDDPEPEEDGGNTGGTNGNGNETTGNGANPNQAFEETIKGLNFGQAMTPELMEDLGNGNVDAFNAHMNGVLQNQFRAVMSVMGHMQRQMQQRFESMAQEQTETAFNRRDQQQELLSSIPEASDPILAPVLDTVYQKALQRTKDPKQAVKKVKEYVREFNKRTGALVPDDGADLNPQWSGGNRGGNTDWSDYFGFNGNNR